MEDLFLLKEMLLKGDYMCKIDLKDAYFSVPLNPKSRKFVSFKWKDLTYQFLCLCFGLGPAPRIFTKLLKAPISLMRKLNVQLIIFLDDILLMAASVEELTLARDTLIYLLQNLGFLINIKKSVLQPCQTIQFLGMEINSIDMTVTLPQEKKDHIVKQCQDLLRKSSVSLRELTQLIGRHCSSASTTPISSNATPANIGVICSRKLQLRNKIIRRGEDRTAMVGTESSLKQREVSYILPSPVTNNLRCIFRRLGCILSRTQNRGAMDITREKRSYKYFRTESSKICNFNFHSLVPNCKNNPYKNGQYCCPFLFGENGRYSKSITCTDQQGNLGIFTGQGDHNYCRVPPRSPQQGSRHAVTNREGFKRMEIKFSGVSKHLQILVDPRYRPFRFQSFPSSSSLCLLETGSIQQRQGCFPNALDSHERICFSPIFSNRQSLTQSFVRSSNVNFDNTSLANTVLVPSVTKALNSKPFNFAQSPDLLQGPNKEPHPLRTKGSLQLLAWIVSGKGYLQKEYQRKLPLLSQMPDDQAQSLITNRPGISGIAGVLGDKLIPLNAL